jgi:Autographiviridae endonuclease VII
LDQQKRKRSHPDFVKKCRIGFIRRKYGITLEDYESMLKKQNNVCAICFKEDMTIEANSMRLKGLCIDHCHITNKVRGLLCNKCNPMIGYSQDSIQILESAIRYLKAHQD